MQAVSGRLNKVFTLAMGNTLVAILNLLAAPFLVRWLNVDDFGTYSQVLMICLLFQSLSTFSLHGVVTPLLTRYGEKPDMVVSTCMRLFLFSVSISATVYFVLIRFFADTFDNPDLIKLLPVAILFFTGQAIIPILNSFLYFHGLVFKSVLFNVIFTGLRIGLMFVIIHDSADLSLVLLSIGLVSWIQAFFLYFSLHRGMRAVSGFNKEVYSSALQIARPLTLSSFVERILYSVDGFTVSILFSAEVFAYYKAGAIDVPLIASLGTATFSVVLPQIAQLFRDENWDEIIRIKRSVMTSIAFFTYPVLIFLLIFHHEIIGFYLSENYLPAAGVFAIYNIAILLKVFDWQDVIVLSGNTRLILFYTTFALLLNLLLCPIMVYLFGYIGAAMAFISSLFFLGYLQLRKKSAILNCRLSDLLNPLALFKIILTSSIVGLTIKSINCVFFMGNFISCLMFFPFIVTVYLINKKLGLLPIEISDYLKMKGKNVRF